MSLESNYTSILAVVMVVFLVQFVVTFFSPFLGLMMSLISIIVISALIDSNFSRTSAYIRSINKSISHLESRINEQQ